MAELLPSKIVTSLEATQLNYASAVEFMLASSGIENSLARSWSYVIRGFWIAFFFAVLTGCASGLVNHSFSFDALNDSPGMRVLDYQYGESKISATRGDKSRAWPRGYGGTSVSGEMLRGDSLYVKWLVEATGKVYEDAVDLKKLTPSSITNHRIYFVVKDDRLLVYLISPEKRPPSFPVNGPKKYHYLQVFTLSSSRGSEAAD